MRRMTLCALLVGGCFEDPDRIASTTIQPMTTEPMESSSSGDGESSESSESSGSTTDDPGVPGNVCPEWCSNGCDLIANLYEQCRCMADYQCMGGLSCDGFDPEPYHIGHCR